MIEAVESPTVNEGKVSENGLVALRLTISTHSTLSFSINGKWEEDASMNKITSSSSHRTLILLDCSSRLRSLASKGVSLASPECNITAGKILKKIQTKHIGKTLKSELYRS